MFTPVEIIVDDTGLSRRVLRFAVIDGIMKLLLDSDQSRKTKRHNWLTNRYWSGSLRSTMQRRPVPDYVIADVLETMREQIVWELERTNGQ